MATEYPTTVRIDTETGTEIGTAVGRPVLLGVYAALWLTFTAGGVFLAVALSGLAGGLLGAALLVTVGLGFVAAGPVAARGTMGRILDRLE